MYSNKMNNLRVRVLDGGRSTWLSTAVSSSSVRLYHRVAIISISTGGLVARAKGRNINFLPFMVI